MANFETNSYIRVKDADGDVHVVYPITKAENVEGLQNLKITCKYEPTTETLKLSNISNVDELANASCVVSALSDDAGNIYKIKTPSLASTTEAGLIKLGNGLAIDDNGNVKVDNIVLEQYYFPLTAGTNFPLQGELYTSGGIRNTDNNDYLAIYGGNDASKGAVIQLYGINNEVNSGGFRIVSVNTTEDKQYWLVGTNTGELTWDGKAVSVEGHTHSEYVTVENLGEEITNVLTDSAEELDITCRNLTVNNDTSLNTLTVTGETICTNITADKVYGALYNDYAEFLPRGEETEAGDIIMLDMDAEEEQYVKAVKGTDVKIAGVHSDEYSHIIGGDEPIGCKGYIAYNLPRYIPTGMVGRCRIKITGPAIKGATIILTDIPGVGRCAKNKTEAKLPSIGYLVETDNIEDETIRRLKVRLKL